MSEEGYLQIKIREMIERMDAFEKELELKKEEILKIKKETEKYFEYIKPQIERYNNTLEEINDKSELILGNTKDHVEERLNNFNRHINKNFDEFKKYIFDYQNNQILKIMEKIEKRDNRIVIGDNLKKMIDLKIMEEINDQLTSRERIFLKFKK